MKFVQKDSEHKNANVLDWHSAENSKAAGHTYIQRLTLLNLINMEPHLYKLNGVIPKVWTKPINRVKTQFLCLSTIIKTDKKARW